MWPRSASTHREGYTKSSTLRSTTSPGATAHGVAPVAACAWGTASGSTPGAPSGTLHKAKKTGRESSPEFFQDLTSLSRINHRHGQSQHYRKPHRNRAPPRPLGTPLPRHTGSRRRARSHLGRIPVSGWDWVSSVGSQPIGLERPQRSATLFSNRSLLGSSGGEHHVR